MDKETLNNMAIQSFKESLENKVKYGNDGFQFQGLVEYEAYNKIFTEKLDVYLIIGGYNPMVKLDIYEKGRKITVDKFHCEFNPRYNDMTFDFVEKDKQLVITGMNSPKHGKYQVKIKEI